MCHPHCVGRMGCDEQTSTIFECSATTLLHYVCPTCRMTREKTIFSNCSVHSGPSPASTLRRIATHLCLVASHLSTSCAARMLQLRWRSLPGMATIISFSRLSGPSPLHKRFPAFATPPRHSLHIF